MSNMGHLIRRQSSRELRTQLSSDRLELKELHHRLLNDNAAASTTYGGTANAAFEENVSQSSTTGSAAGNIVTERERRTRLPSLGKIEEKEEIVGNPSEAELPPKSTAADPQHNEAKESKDCAGGITKAEVPGPGPPVPGEEREEREEWDSKLSFLLATIGYAVGLGNVWRFPYLAQKNGGGAFLIPYALMLAIMGLPLVFLELAIGQRLRKGAIGVWGQISPYLGGIGIASTVVSFNVAVYYNTIIAWCLYYLANSFQSPLPWSECPKEYFDNSSFIDNPECKRSGSTQYFWYRETLDISPDINTPQNFNWKIASCLVVAWILAYLCMAKGIASSGKVVYVTATFPYLVLIIFFVRGMTLPGMEDGLAHLFTPRWEKLADPVVWLEAGTQIFFSLGLAFGGLIAFSSYNSVSSQCYRDAVLVSLTNYFTSMFAGVVVFSVIGFKARMTYENCLRTRNETLRHSGLAFLAEFDNLTHGSTWTMHAGRNISLPKLPECDLQKELDNTASGSGLAFIVCTEAVQQLPFSSLWSILFFLMLFTLGIDSQFGTLEGVVTSIVDLKLFPKLRKEVLTAILCSVCCAISMVFTHGAGNYIFTLFDDFAGNVPLLIIAFFECIAVSYVYGLGRFADDIELMTGSRPNMFWMICWKYLSPLTMVCIVTSSFIKIMAEGSGYQAWVASEGTTVKLEWPIWAQILIAVLVLVSALWIPVIAVTRAFGIRLLADEPPAWFPSNELREYHGLTRHFPTKLESLFFCMHDDGSEGCCCPSRPTSDA